MPTRTALVSLFAFLPCMQGQAQPPWHAEVGYTQLVEEFGVVADGSGVAVALIEGSASGSFMPDVAHDEFANKNLVQESEGDAPPSGHATSVGATFFGKSSLAPGVVDVACFTSSDWLIIRLGAQAGLDPQPLPYAVSNHSYIGDGLPYPGALNLLHRTDFAVSQNDMTMVVGINNGSGNPHPQLLSHAYNVISVGMTNGNHSRGSTTMYGTERIKPEIVAPADTTSAATAMVSSAATLLYDAADDSDATRPEVVKAILLAGATKTEFPTWQRTTTQPLDAAFGAGEMNVYHSYRILAGGAMTASTTQPTAASAIEAWSLGELADVSSAHYYDIDLTQGPAELSVIACWNIDVIDQDSSETFDPTTSLANIDLRLHNSTAGFLAEPVDESISGNHNIEHIYQPILAPGRYTLEVRSDTPHLYAIAWRATAAE